MICFIALFVFLVLSIFSAKYRPLARRALDCVLRRLTLRPCDSGLDTEVKSKILARLLERSPKAARFVNGNFEALSWFFTLLMFASVALSAQGLWNWYVYGNCNGPDSTAFCIYNAFSPHKDAKYPFVESFNPRAGGANASVEIIEFGCFSCPYTKQAEPIRGKLAADYGASISFFFRNFPLLDHPNSNESALAAQAAYLMAPEKYWAFHDAIFENQGAIRAANATAIESLLSNYAEQAGVGGGLAFQSWMRRNETQNGLAADVQAGIEANVRGTPTFFVRNAGKNPGKYMVIAGPQPYFEIRKVVDAALRGEIIDTGSDSSVSSGTCPIDAK
jgi:protein-disulfide isomerase